MISKKVPADILVKDAEGERLNGWISWKWGRGEPVLVVF